MCKFHKDVAREIATNPATGEFDAARYAVALVAMAKYRIEQYMPTMFGCDGYSKLEMAGNKGVKALEFSQLKRPLEDIRDFRAAEMPGLHIAMENISQHHDISIKSLNLPIDPVRDVSFLDEATVELYEGYTGVGYAGGDLHLKPAAHKAAFEPLRAAADAFLNEPGVEPALRQIFKDNLVAVFENARETAATPLLAVKSYFAGSLSRIFKSCAMCARDGMGGAAVSHIGCLTIPAIAAATGTAVSGAVMTGLMYVSSPLIAMGATWGLDRLAGRKTSPAKLAGSAAIAFAVAAGIGAMTGGHDQHGTPGHPGMHGAPAIEAPASSPHHPHHHGASLNGGTLDGAGAGFVREAAAIRQAQRWIDGLDAEEKARAQESARMLHMTLLQYARTICTSAPQKPAEPEKSVQAVPGVPRV